MRRPALLCALAATAEDRPARRSRTALAAWSSIVSSAQGAGATLTSSGAGRCCAGATPFSHGAQPAPITSVWLQRNGGVAREGLADRPVDSFETAEFDRAMYRRPGHRMILRD